jgi:predicted membrane-bound spermidine synthase
VRSRLLAALFFFSGISGLIYQVVWFRKLALIFGVTSYALGTVLAAFMAGLAIGSVAGGWLADRAARPLRVYAIAECAIALAAFTVLPLVDGVQQLYVAEAHRFHGQLTALSAVRFGLSFLMLMPATISMGATLPLGVRAADALGSTSVGRLYAANTAGAVIGVLLAGFLLLGTLGLLATSRIAALLNLLCGGAALIASRGVLTQPAAVAQTSAARTPLTRIQKAAVATIAVSGFAGIAFELIWTRLFAVLAFEVVYGFAIMLAVLLSGIAAGSALYGRFLGDRDRPVEHLVWLQAGIGVIAALSSLLLLPLSHGSTAIGSLPGLGDFVRRCPGCVSLLPGLLAIVFATSALSGASIPAAARVFAASGPRWSTRLGVGYAGNLAGGVAGSAVTGFWLLPALGVHAAVLAVAAVCIGTAIVLAFTIHRRALAVATLTLGVLPFAPAILGAKQLDLFRTALTARLPAATIRWYDEGREASVAVAQTRTDRFLLINGAIHSASSGLPYHRTLGHLGPIVQPEIRDALVVGLGGGATAGALALHPGVHVHVVELSSGVLSAAEHLLADDNYGLFSRPAVTREADDGRNHLLVSGRQYDLIEADIVEPRHAGASVLYSREYFELASKALRPRGIVVQWLGAPNSDAYRWTLSTFQSVFPFVTLWMHGDVGVGSNDPQPALDRARLERMLADPVLKGALNDARIGDIEHLLALRAADPPAHYGPTITDDRPLLEYFITLPFVTRLAFGQGPSAVP